MLKRENVECLKQANKVVKKAKVSHLALAFDCRLQGKGKEGGYGSVIRKS